MKLSQNQKFGLMATLHKCVLIQNWEKWLQQAWCSSRLYKACFPITLISGPLLLLSFYFILSYLILPYFHAEHITH